MAATTRRSQSLPSARVSLSWTETPPPAGQVHGATRPELVAAVKAGWVVRLNRSSSPGGGSQ